MDGLLSLRRCREYETICLGRGREPKDFFYFYSCLISDIHVRFPFDDFTMEVLRVLNVAPTQLHLNSWVALRAFWLLFDVVPIVQLRVVRHYQISQSCHRHTLPLSSQFAFEKSDPSTFGRSPLHSSIRKA